MNEYENDILQIYLNDIRKYPLLTPKQERELADIVQNSNDKKAQQQARDQLVLGNLKLVVGYAVGFYKKIFRIKDVNLSLMDIIEEGNIALLHAAELFSPKKFKDKQNKDIKFCTYAYSAIIRRINRAVKNSHFICIPKRYFKLFKQLEDLQREYGKELNNEIILKRLKITPRTLKTVQESKKISKVSVEDLDDLLEYFNPASEKKTEPDIFGKELKEYLLEKIEELIPSYRDVLFLRFFSEKSMSFEKIGRKKGLSRERIGKIVHRGLRMLRLKIEQDKILYEIKNKNIFFYDFSKRNKYDISNFKRKEISGLLE